MSCLALGDPAIPCTHVLLGPAVQSLTLVLHAEAEGAFLHHPVPAGAICDTAASSTSWSFPSLSFQFPVTLQSVGYRTVAESQPALAAVRWVCRKQRRRRQIARVRYANWIYPKLPYSSQGSAGRRLDSAIWHFAVSSCCCLPLKSVPRNLLQPSVI